MSFSSILAIVAGVVVVAWIIDNIGGGGSGSSSEHTIGDLKNMVDKI